MEIENFRQVVQEIEEEIGRVMVGQQDIIRHTLICLLAGVMPLWGGPGLGKLCWSELSVGC